MDGGLLRPSQSAAVEVDRTLRTKTNSEDALFYVQSLSSENSPKQMALKKPKPPERATWARFDWGFGAVCFGAIPVASALDLPRERDFPRNRIHPNTHFTEAPSE